MWAEPLELVDDKGRRVVIRTLQDAGREIQQRWQSMPKQERAVAYRAMVVEAAGGRKGTARAAVRQALVASGMRES